MCSRNATGDNTVVGSSREKQQDVKKKSKSLLRKNFTAVVNVVKVFSFTA